MAKELKVTITADTTKAVNSMQGFSDSLNKMAKNAAQASSRAAKALNDMNLNPDAEFAAESFVDAQQQADKATQDLIERLEKENAILNQYGVNIQKTEAYIRKLDKAISSVQLMGDYDTADSAIAKLQGMRTNALASVSSMKKQAQTADANNLAFYDLIGDSVGGAREKLAQYEKQLRQVIATQGPASLKASELAEAYKKQAQTVEQLEQSSKKSDGRVKNLIKSFVSAQAIVWAMQEAMQLLVRAFTEWTVAASKAEETANLFNTTFGQISSTANNVATEMASRLGTANSTMQEAIGLFGDFAMGYGQSQAAALEFAKTAAQVNLDLVSFKNISGDISTTMQTFASGLAGNLENFRKLGIIITQTEINSRLAAKGMDKLTGSALQFAKAQETLTIVQEKAANAMGDMEKTLDSTENLNRRVSEANKQLAENLGRSVNTVLNPLKRAWLDIADAINKATSAQTLFDAGQKNIPVYDIKNDEDDKKSFTGAIQIAEDWIRNAGAEIVRNDDALLQKVYDDFYEIFVEYNATFEDLTYDLSQYGNIIQDAIKKASEQAEADRQAETQREALNADIAGRKSNAQSFLSTLEGIAGVSFRRDYGSTIEGFGSYSTTGNAIDNLLNVVINEAISSLGSASFDTFASLADVVFGGNDEQLAALEAKANNLIALYEVLYNAILTGDVNIKDSEEKLKSIVSEWNNVNADIEALKAEMERANAYTEALESATESVAALREKNLTYGFNDREMARYEIQTERNAALANASTAEERIALNKVFDEWIKQNERYYDKLSETSISDFFDTLNSSTGSYAYAGFGTDSAAQEAYNEAMQDGVDQLNSLIETLKGLGYSSEDLSEVQAKAMETIQSQAIAKGQSASSAATKEMWAGVFSNAMSALGDIGSVVTTFTESASIAGGVLGGLVSVLVDLVAQTELLAQLSTALSDAVVPVLNAFLEPLLPFVQGLSAVIQELVYDALNPFYELTLSLGEILTMTLEVMEPVLNIIRTLSDFVGDYLYPIFAMLSDIFSIMIEPLSMIFNILDTMIAPVLNVLIPIFDALAVALTTVYAIVSVVTNFIMDSFKWLLGNIVTFFTSIINWVINTLKKINIFGWRPFGGLKTIDDSKYKAWASTDVFGNVQKNWDKAFDLLDKSNKINMEIAGNTAEDKIDISDFEKVYNAGLISASEFEALVAGKTGQDYKYKDDILAGSGQYIQNQDRASYVSYGNVTIEINGYSGDAKALAKEIKKILTKDSLNPTFDMVV